VTSSASPASPASPTTLSPRIAPTLAETLARIDVLHHRRDDRPALTEERQLIDASTAQSPRDYGVLWRAARLYFWLSDDPSLGKGERSAFGKTGWDLAERAIAIDPGQAPGHYWAAVNMGSYALGLGIMKALTMGMEGKFKDRLQRAGQISPAYEFGGVEVAWGRFYEKLPWPKRDRKRAEEHLRRVLMEQNPNNLRARVFLAETLANDGHAAEAKKLLDEVAAAKAGRYDAPEERRAKAMAVGVLANVTKLLN
jgi:hypothetical protein